MLTYKEKLIIIDKIIVHFAQQGTFSTTSFGDCKYHGLSGEKCALGALIEDAEYVSTIEGGGVNTLLEFYPNKFKADDALFYNKLQTIHDFEARSSKNFDHMMSEYKYFRKSFE